MQKVGIVLPMFNHAEYVALCLDSIVKAKTNINFAVVVLDDESKEEESLKIERLCSYVAICKGIEVQFIRNSKNLGFSGNVNKGIHIAGKIADVTHLCILNSDTIVTDYWLDDLVAEAQNGMVGPVSNSVGNEQIVKVPYKVSGPSGDARVAVQNFASTWRSTHLGSLAETDMLGFFCILAPKSLFNSVGDLDVGFGRGYFEDDDYCLRVRKGGFKLKIVRHCFLHHFGSVTFKSLGQAIVDDLFKKNYALFVAKHGCAPKDQAHSWVTAFVLETKWRVSSGGSIEELVKAWFGVGSGGGCGYISLREQFLYLCDRISEKKIKPLRLRRLLKFGSHLVVGNKAQRVSMLKKVASKFALPFKVVYTKSLSAQLRNSYHVVVILPILGIYGRQQRPQHIPRELAKLGYRVLWVEPSFTGVCATKRIGIEKPADNLFVLNIPTVNFSNFYTSAISTSDASKIVNLVKEVVGGAKVSFIAQGVFWAPIAEVKGAYAFVYDCMDLHVGFNTATVEVEMYEELLLEKADKIVVSTDYLKEVVKKDTPDGQSKPIRIIRNGCDPQHFNNLNSFKILASTVNSAELPVVGYFGAVAEWFDMEILLGAAKALPKVRFEIIGAVTSHEAADLAVPPNVFFLGERKYSDLPELTKNWRVGLIPFKITELIKATNPVKLYEYSALGLPVVATEIPEVIAAGIKVFTASNVDDFAKQILIAMDSNNQASLIERRQFAVTNSWAQRGKQFAEFLGL